MLLSRHPSVTILPCATRTLLHLFHMFRFAVRPDSPANWSRPAEWGGVLKVSPSLWPRLIPIKGWLSLAQRAFSDDNGAHTIANTNTNTNENSNSRLEFMTSTDAYRMLWLAHCGFHPLLGSTLSIFSTNEIYRSCRNVRAWLRGCQDTWRWPSGRKQGIWIRSLTTVVAILPIVGNIDAHAHCTGTLRGLQSAHPTIFTCLFCAA